MKTKLLLLFSFITFSNFAQTLPAYVPKSGLIAYYPFDNNANDISGNLNNGAVNGAVLTEDRTGKLNSAYSFNGVSSYIDATTTNIPQGNAARTISGWFKTNTPNPGENGDVCIFNYGTLSRLQRFGLTIYSKGYLQTSTGPNAIGDDFYVNNFDYLSNDWYFFTLTYNGTKVSLYVNGVLASEKVANLSTLNNIFRIGKRISGDTTSEFFKGTIDDIGIWNRVLTPQEISAMYVDAPERLDLYTLIPDSNFEQKLIDLGLDSGLDGKVLTNNIKTVKSLEIDTRTVADLTGIAGFKALETLVCIGRTAIRFEGGDGKLTTLDVSKNLNLKTLDCSSNQLTNLDVSKNPDLRTLNIMGNKITSIDVTKNLYLYKLNTSLNPLTTIDVSKNLNLNILDVSGTKLTEINVSQDIALTNLNISGINIPTIDVSQNINLMSLYCDVTNSLTSLDLSKNTKLYALSCTYNKITSLDLSKNLALTRLFCESNQLTTLDVSKNTALTELNFSDNKISSIDISKCTSLTNLDCTNNLLTDVNLSANTKLDKAILDKNSFTTLDVSKNTALKTLWCGENQLTSITLPESNTLEVLYLNSNKFTALDISKYTALKEFVCSTNQLTDIDVSKNTALTYFHCHENELKSLDVTKNTLLTSLYCHTNQLSTLDVSKNKALTTLWCHGNQLTDLDVSQNTALTKLTSHRNKLTTLNVKNGNNSNLNIYTSGFTNNPDLTCIQVDDVAYANTNWTAKKDATASFNTYCTDGYTLIPDVNFENKLIALDLDSGVADGKVLTKKIAKVTYLNLTDSSISDLKGIEGFTSLTDLSIGGNNLTTLDLSKNTALTNLTCNYNKLTTLDLTKNIALTHLTCSSNQLKALNINQCSELEFLKCSENSLASLDLSNNTKLQILDCSNNQLTNLSLDKNVNLLALTVGNNQLTTLDVKDNLILDLLDFSGNQVKTIDISKQKNLTQLFCGSNELKMLDASKNNALKILNCSNNPSLQSLNLKNGNNKNFLTQALNLSSNPTLTCIEVDDVDYSNNNWADAKDKTANYNLDCPDFFTLIPDKNFEQKLIDLGIDSGTPDGKVATSSINYVITLDVADSNISDLTGLQDFASLKYFFCDRNKLTTADFSKNLMLENIGILDNAFTSIDVTKNTKLHTLELSKNHISTVDLSQNTNLKRLGFENNNFKEIDLSHNTELWFISGFGNQLTNLDLSKNTALTTLNVSNNQLVELNLRNGNNSNFDLTSNLKSNPKLTCIQVDNEAFSSAKWGELKDNTANYSNDCNAYTVVADSNFEDKLIALGIDKDGKNGKIKTADISSITSLDLSNSNITDLSGLEYFTALTYLDCDNNNLTSIDVSKNTLLTKLSLNNNKLTSLDISANTELFNLAFSINQISSIDLSQNKKVHYVIADRNLLTSIDFSANPEIETIYCGQNNLTSLNVSNLSNLKDLNCIYTNISQLDVTSNPKLENLYFNDAKLTTLDLSKNPLLKRLNVSNNQLTTLDISHNPLLELIFVEFNPLVSLNVKNGNNKNFILPTKTGKKTATPIYTSFLNNLKLSCIQVDDVEFSNTNWAGIKDQTATYSSTCKSLGLEDSVFDKAAIYPNPTKGEVNILNVAVEKVTIYNSAGQLVKSFKLNVSDTNNQIDLSGLPRGVYYLYLINQDAASAKKIVVE